MMYDENNNREFNHEMNPDEHKAEEMTTNFVMRDSQQQPQERSSQMSGYAGQESGYSSQEPGYSGREPEYRRQEPEESRYTQQRQYQDSRNYYQTQEHGGYQTSHIPPEPPKKEKKKRTMAGKVAGITAAALLFGTVSGGTMVGISSLADSFQKETYPQISQAETLPESTTSGSGSSGSAQASIALATDVSSIVEEAMPSVVAINNTMLYRGSTWFGQTQTYEVPSSGSGIIVGQNDEELLIVTNNHVVEGSSSLSVTFIDDEAVNAAIKGTDSESDLAVIAVPLKDISESTMSQISVARMGNSDELKVGQGVIAIGNALGYGQSVTVGYVSALNREVRTDNTTTRNLLQTDAAINPGNSGGALLNMRGEVIGINAAKYSSTEVEGMGYAIPISKAQEIINNLMTKRTRVEAEEGKAGYLGIQGTDVDEEMASRLGMPTGIFVYKILEDGAASKTDLREKDIITKFDDQTVKTMANLQEMLRYYEEGETVNLTVMSLENGTYTERIVTVTLGAKAVTQVE